MDLGVVADVPAVLRGGGAAQVDRPLLTYCDDATGERVDLSVAALSGWAARTAGLLHEGCRLRAGARMAVLLPPHWQTAAVLLGAWSAGLAVSFRPWATAGLPVHEPGTDRLLDAVFVARNRVDNWLDDVPDAIHRFVLGFAPGAAPLADVPDGYRDYIAEVGGHSTSLPGYGEIGRTAAASVDGTTFREWGALALALAERLDLRSGDRLLVDVANDDHPVKWLLAPLSVGASVVLCANLAPGAAEARAAAERVTRVL